jgi:diguanylate cyclase (GGDEF)-like protein
VIVVGPSPDLGDAAETIVHAANLFEAVGEVTIATATEPVDAVFVPARLLEGPASITVEAFRRIDPSVRLVLVAATEREAHDHAERNGFEEVILEPLTAAGLALALGNGREQTSVESQLERPALPEPDKRPSDDEVLDLLETDTPTSAVVSDELGDTDLVEALLAGESIRGRALALVAQQTGWTDIELGDEPPAGEGWSCTEVQFGATGFGILATRHAAASRLRPWAQWLARWLALDHRHRDYRMLAYKDELTGAWNRRFFRTFMKRILQQAQVTRRPVTLLVFDLDDFKQYNDRYGHEAGDEILRETVRLLYSVIRSGDRVCRIGGDEFVVIFSDMKQPRKPGSNPPETVEQIADRFQSQVCRMKFPKLGLDAPGTLSISGGLATYPWDGGDADSLLRHADQLALQSKRTGKNLITLGPGVRRVGDGQEPSQ